MKKKVFDSLKNKKISVGIVLLILITTSVAIYHLYPSKEEKYTVYIGLRLKGNVRLEIDNEILINEDNFTTSGGFHPIDVSTKLERGEHRFDLRLIDENGKNCTIRFPIYMGEKSTDFFLYILVSISNKDFYVSAGWRMYF